MNKSTTGQGDSLESLFVKNRDMLLAFVRRRVGDDELAEDVLQDSMLKALQRAPDITSEDRLLAWFFRVLRNAVVDAYRRSGASERGLERLRAMAPETAPTPEDEAVLCLCFRELLPTLTPEYAQLIEAMDLGEATPQEMELHLGITANNLKVRRHRARRQLRRRLETTCGTCAEHGCTDCSCRQNRVRQV